MGHARGETGIKSDLAALPQCFVFLYEERPCRPTPRSRNSGFVLIYGRGPVDCGELEEASSSFHREGVLWPSSRAPRSSAVVLIHHMTSKLRRRSSTAAVETFDQLACKLQPPRSLRLSAGSHPSSSEDDFECELNSPLSTLELELSAEERAILDDLSGVAGAPSLSPRKLRPRQRPASSGASLWSVRQGLDKSGELRTSESRTEREGSAATTHATRQQREPPYPVKGEDQLRIEFAQLATANRRRARPRRPASAATGGYQRNPAASPLSYAASQGGILSQDGISSHRSASPGARAPAAASASAPAATSASAPAAAGPGVSAGGDAPSHDASGRVPPRSLPPSPAMVPGTLGWSSPIGHARPADAEQDPVRSAMRSRTGSRVSRSESESSSRSSGDTSPPTTPNIVDGELPPRAPPPELAEATSESPVAVAACRPGLRAQLRTESASAPEPLEHPPQVPPPRPPPRRRIPSPPEASPMPPSAVQPGHVDP